jgi:hypothetical protein
MYWLLVAAIATGIAAAAASAMGDVRRQRQAWGQATTVFVATRDIAVGEPLAGNMVTRDVPIAVVPPSAMTSMPADATAVQRVAAGEIVVTTDVVDATGPLALVPSGWLAIDIPSTDDPLETARSLFGVGDSAVVLADGSIVAERAIVVDVAPDGLAVAVPRDVAARVAQAANQRVAVLALSGS